MDTCKHKMENKYHDVSGLESDIALRWEEYIENNKNMIQSPDF